jgi:type II secretory ATPase GspE/PulE/Tfp pilus assembly ATPase PilB-like protein
VNGKEKRPVSGKASIEDYLPLPGAGEQFPLEYMQNCSVIKLREETGRVIVGMCEPDNLALQESLRAFHRKEVVFCEIDRSELAVHLGRMLSASSPAAAGQSPDAEKLLLDRLANDAPVVNLVNGILIEGIRGGASDVHIEAFPSTVSVRYRVDGVLRAAGSFERSMFPAVSSRIKIMANLNIMERRLPQDGRLTVHLDADVMDVRVSIMPIADGESIVLRLFNKESAPLTLEELGFGEEHLKLLRRLSRLPHGLVLATGPTGSGKTTTLNAILRRIDAESRKVITIEDPIEYILKDINQVQTNDRIGLTFESILRRVLRQDPDVVMVGEIRDTETSELAVRAALTGHLVFSTLHTNDSVSAVARLKNMRVPPYLIAAVLRAAMAQRLVRRLCPECRRKERPTALQRTLFEQNGVSPARVWRAAGCAACHSTGYRGRVALVEMFASDEQVEQMIVDKRPAGEISRHLAGRGMKTLLADGLAKAAAGLTSFEEIERTVMLL